MRNAALRFLRAPTRLVDRLISFLRFRRWGNRAAIINEVEAKTALKVLKEEQHAFAISVVTDLFDELEHKGASCKVSVGIDLPN